MKKIFILFIILLCSSCKDYNELNDLAIVNSVGIDKDDNNYKVCIEVLNTDKKNSKNIMYYSKGKTINDAINKINNKTAKKVYGGHLNKVIVSKEILNEKKLDLTDMFLRLTEIKDEFDLFISKDSNACEIVKSLSELKNDSSSKLLSNSKKYTSLSSNTNVDTFISTYLKKGIDPVLSTLKKEKDEIVVDNIAITKNGRFLRYLDDKETLGYNFIRNEINDFSMPIKYKDKYLTIKINNSKTNNKVYKKNDKYLIEINIKVDSYLTEYDLDLDLNKNETIKKIEKLAKEEITKYIKKAIRVQDETNSNYLGFERMIYENYPKEKEYKYNIKTNIDVNLKRKGEIKSSIKEK